MQMLQVWTPLFPYRGFDSILSSFGFKYLSKFDVPLSKVTKTKPNIIQPNELRL